jgi:RNA-binding protein YhbY
MEKFHETLLDSAHLNIGKNGITPGMIQHITNLFKRNPLLKVKVLQEIAHEKGIDPFIETLIRELHVYIYDARGFTFIISKRHYPELHEPKHYHKLRKEIIALQEDKGNKTQQESKSANATSKNEDFIDYDNEEVQKQLEAFDEEIEEELSARNPHVKEELVESEKKHTESEIKKGKPSEKSTPMNQSSPIEIPNLSVNPPISPSETLEANPKKISTKKRTKKSSKATEVSKDAISPDLLSSETPPSPIIESESEAISTKKGLKKTTKKRKSSL